MQYNNQVGVWMCSPDFFKGETMEKENFRRRSRYILVFGVLAAAFCVVTVLNINTGNGSIFQ